MRGRFRLRPIALLVICWPLALPVCVSADAGSAPLIAIEERILVLVNQHRVGAGLGTLASDARVAELARRHSASMADGKASFGHDGWGERSEAVYASIPALRVAENVSRHRGRKADEVPGAALESWLGSAVHLKNIDGKTFDLTGIGAARAADGTFYITQIFVEREPGK